MSRHEPYAEMPTRRHRRAYRRNAEASAALSAFDPRASEPTPPPPRDRHGRRALAIRRSTLDRIDPAGGQSPPIGSRPIAPLPRPTGACATAPARGPGASDCATATPSATGCCPLLTARRPVAPRALHAFPSERPPRLVKGPRSVHSATPTAVPCNRLRIRDGTDHGWEAARPRAGILRAGRVKRFGRRPRSGLEQSPSRSARSSSSAAPSGHKLRHRDPALARRIRAVQVRQGAGDGPPHLRGLTAGSRCHHRRAAPLESRSLLLAVTGLPSPLAQAPDSRPTRDYLRLATSTPPPPYADSASLPHACSTTRLDVPPRAAGPGALLPDRGPLSTAARGSWPRDRARPARLDVLPPAVTGRPRKQSLLPSDGRGLVWPDAFRNGWPPIPSSSPTP